MCVRGGLRRLEEKPPSDRKGKNVLFFT